MTVPRDRRRPGRPGLVGVLVADDVAARFGAKP